jgi:serine protease Do
VKPISTFIIICALIAVSLTGCQTTGTTSDEISYNMFFSPEDHIKQLIEENKLEEADSVYQSQRDFFTPKKEGEEAKKSLTGFFSGGKKDQKEKPVLDVLSDAINERFASKGDRSFQNLLPSEDWPTEISNWGAVESGISSAEAVISEYEGYSILRESIRQSPFYSKLKKNLPLLKAAISESRDQLFEQHSLAESPVFFSQFPIKKGLGDYLDGKEKIWRSKIVNLSPSQLANVFDDYKSWLSDQLQQEMGSLYFDSHVSELSQDGKSSFSAILAALKATREAGMTIKNIPDSKLTILEVTSRTLLEQGQIEFPTAIDVNLPFKFEQLEFDEAIQSPIAKTTDIVVLIDVAVARTNREISSYEKINSEFQSGTKTVQNPDYNIAQNEVNNAQLKVQSAAMNAASASSQYCYGMGCIGKAIGELAAAAAQGAAQETLQEQMSVLQSTPMTIDKPVYTPYKFRRAAINVTKEATVNYYVIDRAENKYMRDTYDAKQSRSFKVAYNLHENDRSRSSHLSSSDSEDDVVKFEKEEISVLLSDILDQFEGQSALVQNLPSLTKIRNEILKDKNKVLAEFKKQQFDVTPDKNDPRFDNVVVVYHPGGGLGTGFFIRDDIVLTNYHVIEGSQFVEMKLFNGQETFGKVVGKDIRLDLAIIKSQARGKPVTFFADNNLPLGKTVEVIGHPTGLEFSISRGVISALREIESSYMRGGKKVRFIQTDASINPGNSGGPLFLRNKVIGVNTQKLAKTELEGLGFSIHYSEVLAFLRKEDIQVGN